MALFLTNPYNNFKAANSKEYISFDKGAKQDFRPETCFDIIPGNSNLFSAQVEKCATQFGYGSLLNVPSDCDVDATDSSNGDEGGSTHCSKRDPYTVAAWRLTKKEDKVCMHGKNYFWCTGNHWSGGRKHNGIYII
jgi:hypothetical protein